MSDPDEILIDPPDDEVSVLDTISDGIILTEITVPLGLALGQNAEACLLRTMATYLQDADDAGRPRVVHSVQVQYERDPFPMVMGVLITGPQADQGSAGPG